MRMRRGWYLRWVDDRTETEWLGTCPKYLKSMQDIARRRGEELIVTPIKTLGPKIYFCIECQARHA